MHDQIPRPETNTGLNPAPILMYPPTYIFRPLQVAHTLKAQFPTPLLQLACSHLEPLLRMDLLTKLAYTLYTHLLIVALADLSSL